MCSLAQHRFEKSGNIHCFESQNKEKINQIKELLKNLICETKIF
jgi:hypothetical protein